ncbi:MAG: ABC transporter ATP-binding protein [Coriobacteriales bacterium]|jgi:ABC-2 type transport system ATP-binding protein|nr:ABC transporter ATP-binding protein [Coriobacteriales bacterium]
MTDREHIDAGHAAASYAIECTNLRLRYPRQRTEALAGMSFAVPQGAICGLFGRNGAGKTSLMALLAGLRRPSGGSVRVFGEDPWENARVAPQVAFVFSKTDSDAVINSIRVRDLLKMGALFRPNWDAGFAAHLLKRFDVPLKKTPSKMSQGQAAALRCTIGLASRAPLTIFDEAYLGMDAVYRKIFIDELLTDYLTHPRTILFSTHYIAEMERLFSEAVIIDAGQVLIHDDADTLRERGKTLQDLFISLTLKEGENYDN